MTLAPGRIIFDPSATTRRIPTQQPHPEDNIPAVTTLSSTGKPVNPINCRRYRDSSSLQLALVPVKATGAVIETTVASVAIRGRAGRVESSNCFCFENMRFKRSCGYLSISSRCCLLCSFCWHGMIALCSHDSTFEADL